MGSQEVRIMKLECSLTVLVLVATALPVSAGHYGEVTWDWTLVPPQKQVGGGPPLDTYWVMEATGAGGTGTCTVLQEAFNRPDDGVNTPVSGGTKSAEAGGTGTRTWILDEGEDADPPEDVEAAALLTVSVLYWALCEDVSPCSATASATASGGSLGITLKRPLPNDPQSAIARWEGPTGAEFGDSSGYGIGVTIEGAGVVQIAGTCAVTATASRTSNVDEETVDMGVAEAHGVVSMEL